MTAHNLNPDDGTIAQEATVETAGVSAAKKTFVEPAISHPVDVLEATTYFQVVESGGTGLRKQQGPASPKGGGPGA